MLEMRVSLAKQDVPVSLIHFLEKTERDTTINFFYLPSWIEYISIPDAYDQVPLRVVLDEVLQGSDVTYSAINNHSIVFVMNPKHVISRAELLDKAMAEKKSISRMIIGNPADYRPNLQFLVKGILREQDKSLTIRNATVALLDSETGTTTNELGYYEIKLPAGEHLLSFRHANYSEKIIDLRLYANGRLDLEMEETAILLDEVVIADRAIEERTTGLTTLKLADIKRSPTFLGEVDIVKQIQSQPGVTTVGEVAAGFNVRGGGVDQNLVLYDGLPIFNTSHALGFFSAFNADIINGVSFYKGGIPAEFGGRSSSVLNISSREGSYEKWSGAGGIGMISSQFNMNGPIKKDTTSLMVSFRTTYSDWLLRAVESNYGNIKNSSITFYDGTIKLAHRLNSKTKLTLSAYSSRDNMKLVTDTAFQWSNLSASLRIDREATKNLFYSATVGFGSYSYLLREERPANAFDLQYQILYPTLKVDFNYTRKRPAAFGMIITYYTFSPGSITPTSAESNIKPQNIQEERSIESALYYSTSFRFGQRFFLDAGIRYALYARIGTGTVYQYDPSQPLEPKNIIDSTQYSSGQVMKFYQGPEPRLLLRYSLDAFSSLKFGYNRMHQFVHLVTNTASITPVDIWQSGNTFFKPQVADQVSIGYYRSMNNNMFEVTADLYYKQIQNILDFKDGSQLILNDKLETALLQGTAQAYGVELGLNKLRGRLQGSINYTYARSLRVVNGAYESEKINQGKVYPSNYDQPNIVNVNWRYAISRRHFFTGNFTYHTGRPISLPQSVYYADRMAVSDFPERNTFRLPDYHRLDLAFVIEGNHRRRKLWDGTWTVSVYNVYSRQNAYSVYFQENKNGMLQPYVLSIVASAIPTISYSFKF